MWDNVRLLYRRIWRPLSLSELVPMIFNMGLPHLGSEASNYLFFSQASRLNIASRFTD